MKEIKRHCAYIDGTTGRQCVLSMSRVKGFPSKARVARGDLETPKGTIRDRVFYICVPAENFRPNRSGRKLSYDKMVEEQKQCSHFDTRRKITIPKKFHAN